MANDVTDDVTVLVFKDNYAARTFQIPLKWISRFGLLLWLCVGVTALSLFFGIKYYRIARQADPVHIRNLEGEISDLRASYHALELKALEPRTAASGLPQDASASSVSAIPALQPGPIPTVTVTALPGPIPTVTVTAAAPGPSVPAATGAKPLLFSALPLNITDLPKEGTEIPITLNALKAQWAGKNLRVSFNIQYVKKDGGAQQGRIVILARGPDTIFSYPSGTLNNTGTDSLIVPNAGEYFSVSRYRDTRAEFGPIRNNSQIKSVEVLIISQPGQILIHQKTGVSAPPASAAPQPKEASAQQGAPSTPPADGIGPAAPAQTTQPSGN